MMNCDDSEIMILNNNGNAEVESIMPVSAILKQFEKNNLMHCCKMALYYKQKAKIIKKNLEPLVTTIAKMTKWCKWNTKELLE